MSIQFSVVFVAEVSLNGHEHAAGEVNVALAWMPPELMFTDPFLHRLGFPIEIAPRLDQDLANRVRKWRHGGRSFAGLYGYEIARPQSGLIFHMQRDFLLSALGGK